jgi:bifunctional UDP-N-acetylglucosamine pyrophosphorylase/glucosamine-1-phosphate N-acetyltransferase
VAGRVLVIPAAGRGSRLGSDLPKALVSVAGRPMLDWLIDLHSPHVERFIVVANAMSRTSVSEHLARVGAPSTVLVQETPTGMLDAILLARPIVEASAAGHVWITWCDQIAVHPQTVERLAALSDANPSSAIVMPTCTRLNPYIHLQRGASNRIATVLQRREGDMMPMIGEGDVGLFSLSHRAFVEDLHDYADSASVGESTGERNFLPFIPWAEARGGVLTYPCVDEREAIGVNTPEELSLIEAYLRTRARS